MLILLGCTNLMSALPSPALGTAATAPAIAQLPAAEGIPVPPRQSADDSTLPSGHLPEPKPLLLFATGFLGLAIGVHIRRKF